LRNETVSYTRRRRKEGIVTDTEIELSGLGLPEARGARRGPERREAICAAVFELLAEVGYDRMTMDAVATRARASKATIYRTWPDKPGLVAEALVNRFGPTPEPPNTGSLRGDIMALMSLACDITNSPDGEVITGVMTAAARNPALARTVHECTYASKRILNEAIINQAAARGEVGPDADPDLFHEVMHAMIMTRKLGGEQPLDEEFVRHVVDDIIIPLLKYRPCDGDEAGA
jgi:AcrR family transcriptional regulator